MSNETVAYPLGTAERIGVVYDVDDAAGTLVVAEVASAGLFAAVSVVGEQDLAWDEEKRPAYLEFVRYENGERAAPTTRWVERAGQRVRLEATEAAAELTKRAEPEIANVEECTDRLDEADADPDVCVPLDDVARVRMGLMQWGRRGPLPDGVPNDAVVSFERYQRERTLSRRYDPFAGGP